MRLTRLDFASVARAKAKRVRYGAFALSLYPHETLKIGCVISKKYVKTAVQRHQLKRKVYNFFIQQGFSSGWYVLYVQGSIKTSDINNVSISLKSLFSSL